MFSCRCPGHGADALAREPLLGFRLVHVLAPYLLCLAFLGQGFGREADASRGPCRMASEHRPDSHSASFFPQGAERIPVFNPNQAGRLVSLVEAPNGDPTTGKNHLIRPPWKKLRLSLPGLS